MHNVLPVFRSYVIHLVIGTEDFSSKVGRRCARADLDF